jgi:cytochrome c peroxidase
MLGGPAEPSLARQGEAIFFDGQRSLDQWYSCNSCHYEGGTNAVTMDNRSDGRAGHAKTVLPLHNVTRSGPYRWNGWQTDLNDALRKSFVDTMQGKQPSADDLKALTAYLETLKTPLSPHRAADGGLTDAAQRGKQVFESDKGGCVRCHSGPLFTDGKVHEVGLSKVGDPYRGFKTPSLLGLHDHILYLHDGRARSLEELLQGPHSSMKVTRRGELTEAEVRDLILYLRSL